MTSRANPLEQPSLCLGFATAALYWRAVRVGDLSMPTPLTLTSVPDSCTAGARRISRVDLSPLDKLPIPSDGSKSRLHVMISDQTHKWRNREVRAHLSLSTLPPESIFRVSPEIIVASPELTLLQLARTSRLLPSIELACEWCGSYALTSGEDSCLYDRTPITDPTRLKKLLAQKPKPRGSTAMIKVVEFAGERLASPRETECFLILVLPVRLGGFALPVPLVNQQIPLGSTPFGALSKHKFYLVDFLWPDARLVVEYDGLDDHEVTPQQVAADKERRSVLAALGYTVIVITKRDLESLPALERKVQQIVFALGVKVESPMDEKGSSEAQKARKALFAWLFDCKHDHLPFGFGYQ